MDCQMFVLTFACGLLLGCAAFLLICACMRSSQISRRNGENEVSERQRRERRWRGWGGEWMP